MFVAFYIISFYRIKLIRSKIRFCLNAVNLSEIYRSVNTNGLARRLRITVNKTGGFFVFRVRRLEVERRAFEGLVREYYKLSKVRSRKSGHPLLSRDAISTFIRYFGENMDSRSRLSRILVILFPFLPLHSTRFYPRFASAVSSRFWMKKRKNR